MLQDTEQEPAGTRSTATLVAAATTGLGALAAAQLSVLGQLRVGVAAVDGGVQVNLVIYSPVVALVAALVAWHLFPRRSWPVLVVAGAVCSVPNLLLLLAPYFFVDWMAEPYLVIDSIARPLLLVGLLGAATTVWRAGRRRAGGVLLGTALVVPPLIGFMVAAYMFDLGIVVPMIGAVLVLAAIVVTAVAATTAPPPAEPEPRPEWRVTAAGAVAGVAPVIYLWWRAPRPDGTDGDAAAHLQGVGQHALIVGLVVLGIGLLAGLAAGARVFVTATAAGVLLGAVPSLAGPAASDLHDVPAVVPPVVALLALVTGIACALPRYRLMIGVPGLGVLVAGLLVLYEVFTADDPILDADITNVLTPALLAVTVVAMLAVLTSLGMVVAPPGTAPAAFAGVAGAVAVGVTGIGSYISLDPPADTPPALAPYPLVMALLVVAGALALFAHHRWQREDRD